MQVKPSTRCKENVLYCLGCKTYKKKKEEQLHQKHITKKWRTKQTELD